MTNWTPPSDNQPTNTINEIIVQSPTSVLINGVDCGKLCDAMANMPQFASQFQIALETAWSSHLQSLTGIDKDS